MRLANRSGRLVLVDADTTIDVALASRSAFGPDPAAVLADWARFRGWAGGLDVRARADLARPMDVTELEALTTRPPQVFAIGLNYRDHAIEAGFAEPVAPVVFTKYASSLTGPAGDVVLSSGSVDWEVELVAVIGIGGRDIPADRAWDHVAGLTLGQDISDRVVQTSAPPAQFGLAKSFARYSPIGPVLVTPDEFPDPDAIGLGCSVDGRTVQESSTAQMVFPVPALVAHLSSIVELMPGDLVFTGTPAGVGMGQRPPVYLQPDQVLRSWADGIGEMVHTVRAPGPQQHP